MKVLDIITDKKHLDENLGADIIGAAGSGLSRLFGKRGATAFEEMLIKKYGEAIFQAKVSRTAVPSMMDVVGTDLRTMKQNRVTGALEPVTDTSKWSQYARDSKFLKALQKDAEKYAGQLEKDTSKARIGAAWTKSKETIDSGLGATGTALKVAAKIVFWEPVIQPYFEYLDLMSSARQLLNSGTLPEVNGKPIINLRTGQPYTKDQLEEWYDNYNTQEAVNAAARSAEILIGGRLLGKLTTGILGLTVSTMVSKTIGGWIYALQGPAKFGFMKLLQLTEPNSTIHEWTISIMARFFIPDVIKGLNDIPVGLLAKMPGIKLTTFNKWVTMTESQALSWITGIKDKAEKDAKDTPDDKSASDTTPQGGQPGSTVDASSTPAVDAANPAETTKVPKIDKSKWQNNVNGFYKLNPGIDTREKLEDGKPNPNYGKSDATFKGRLAYPN